MKKELKLLVLFVIIACSVMNLSAAGQSEIEKKPITISFLASAGGSGRSFAAGAEMFNEKYAGQYYVNVTLTAWDAVLEQATMQFISKQPAYDVVAIDQMWLPLIQMYAEPLNSYADRDRIDVNKLFGEKTVGVMTYNENIIAFPIRTGVIIGYYREDLFKEAGLSLPETLEEFQYAASVLNKINERGEIVRYGTSLMAQHPTWTTWLFSQFARPQGIYYLNPNLDGPSEDLKGEGTIKILNFIKELHDAPFTPESLEWTYDDNIVAFQTDRMAFSAEFSQRALALEDPNKSSVVGKMIYKPLPTGRLGSQPSSHAGGGWTLVMDKNSTNKEAAFEFIRFMTSNYETQKMMAMKHQNGPALIAVYDDKEYLNGNPSAIAIKEVLETDSYDVDFPVRNNPELSMAVHEELQAFLLGRKTARQTGINMYDRIKMIMSK